MTLSLQIKAAKGGGFEVKATGKPVSFSTTPPAVSLQIGDDVASL